MMKRFCRDHNVRGIALTSCFPTAGHQSWHFLMMTFISLIIFTFIISLSGCRGGGGTKDPSNTATLSTDNTPTTVDDTPPTVDPVVDNTGYTGSARVSGTIKLSYLSSSDTSQVEFSTPDARATAFRPRTSKTVDTETEAVNLYVMGANGEQVDTGITCTITDGADGDPAYKCDDVKDGVNYIVRYVKLNSSTSKALEMKSNAYIPSG